MGLQPCLRAHGPGQRLITGSTLAACHVNNDHPCFRLPDRSPILIASLRPRCYGLLQMGGAGRRRTAETLTLLARTHGRGYEQPQM